MSTSTQEGNVTGERPGIGAGPLLALAAHLDTVFSPKATDVHVRKEGISIPRRASERTYPWPGNPLLAIIRALDGRACGHARATFPVVADVGEEGLGNSRGIHYCSKRANIAGR